jgi:GT2 family glycosyltransferase
LDISIIIVNYNSLDFIKECLKSIKRLSGSGRDKKSKASYEILVVDNKSGDRSADYLSERAKIDDILHFIPNKYNVGFSRASNLGALRARGKYLLFLNPDTKFLQGDLRSLIDFYDDKDIDSRVGVIGVKILNPDGTLQLSSRSFPTLARQFYESYFLYRIFKKTRVFGSYFMSWWDHKEERKVDWLAGSFIFIKRDVFMKAGMFDEDYFMYSEDSDLCLQLYRKGFKNYYFPYFIIEHIDRAVASRNMAAREAGIWTSRRLYFIKNYSRTHAVLLSLIYLAGIINRILLFILLCIFKPVKASRARLFMYFKVLNLYFGGRSYES